MAALTGKWKTIADDIDAVFKRHGMERKGFRVSLGEFESRVTVTVLGNANSTAPVDRFAKNAAEFTRYHARLGFKPGWLNAEFSWGSTRFKLVGLDMGRPKNCVVIQNVRTGKTHVAKPEFVLSCFGQRPANRPLGIDEELLDA